MKTKDQMATSSSVFQSTACLGSKCCSQCLQDVEEENDESIYEVRQEQENYEGGGANNQSSQQEMQALDDLSRGNVGGGAPQPQEQKFTALQRKGTINIIGQYNQEQHLSRSVNFRHMEQDYLAQSGAQPQAPGQTASSGPGQPQTGPSQPGNNLPTGLQLNQEQVQRLQERQRRERENPLQSQWDDAQIAALRSKYFQNCFWNTLYGLVYTIILAVQADDNAHFAVQFETIWLWVRINVGYHWFLSLFNFGVGKALSLNNARAFQNFASLIMLPDFVFSIWGCTLMFGQDYVDKTQFIDSENKPAYHTVFEVMVWIRFIGLLCCGCVFTCLCCLLMIKVSQGTGAAESPEQRQQVVAQMQNIPYVGRLTHAFIDSKTTKYDESKMQGAEMCVICMVDFKDEPEKPVAELNCSNKHIFHAECLKNWVERNNQCPLCKEPIPDKV